MGRTHTLKASFLLAITATAFLASTPLVHAIDSSASAARQKAIQQATAETENIGGRMTRMEAQIARLNEELVTLHEDKIRPQQTQGVLQATKELK